MAKIVFRSPNALFKNVTTANKKTFRAFDAPTDIFWSHRRPSLH